MNLRIILAALAVATIAFSAPAEARYHQSRMQTGNPTFGNFDAAATPAYPVERQARTRPARLREASHTRPAFRLASYTPEHGLANERAPKARTLGAYANAPAYEPSAAEAARGGLVTINVAGGHRITVSQAFAEPITSLITDLDARGYRFTRIKCFANHGEGHHKSRSNHWAGNACDFFGQHPPASITRAHDLRSGCDFHDCMHVDNARNVGGVAYWNSVKHRGPTVTASAERRHHYRHRIRYARR
jgi:hypothetical protein